MVSFQSMFRLTIPEFDNLHARTGTEAIFFTTRSSSDVALKNLYFTTPGVKDFMEMTLKIDPNQFLAKMEGYAINGLKGMSYIDISKSIH